MAKLNQVLLVDDDPICNQKNEKLLKEASIAKEVKVTLNGGHALLYLDHLTLVDKFSKLLVLLDVDMPIMNGLEFLEYFNRSNTIPKDNILIVIQGDDLRNEVVEKAKNLGVSHFVSKSSLSIDHLNTILNTHFSDGSVVATQSQEENQEMVKPQGNNYNFQRKKGARDNRNRTAA